MPKRQSTNNAPKSIVEKMSSKGLKCHLIDLDKVIEIYKSIGYDFDNMDEENAPDFIAEVEGSYFFFTGWKITRNDKDYEFAIELGQNFTPEELDSILPIDEDNIETVEADD